MSRSAILLLAALSCLLGACGWQTKTAPPEAAVTAAPHATRIAANNTPEDPNQIVCQRQEVTGSRLEGSRECHTRAEWAQLRATGMDKLQMLGEPGPTQGQMQAGVVP